MTLCCILNHYWSLWWIWKQSFSEFMSNIWCKSTDLAAFSWLCSLVNKGRVFKVRHSMLEKLDGASVMFQTHCLFLLSLGVSCCHLLFLSYFLSVHFSPDPWCNSGDSGSLPVPATATSGRLSPRQRRGLSRQSRRALEPRHRHRESSQNGEEGGGRSLSVEG